MDKPSKAITRFASLLAILLVASVFTGKHFAGATPTPGSRRDTPKDAESSYDVLIKNGRIVDGSGNPWYAGDVAIRGDRIAAIGKLGGATAKRVIDAAGRIVAPGFIDMLGQSEAALVIDNRSPSK